MFSLFSQQHPGGVPANKHNTKLKISSFLVEKGQANTLASMLEVLYLSTDPNICVVQPSVHCLIVCGTACERKLFLKCVCAARACNSESTLCVCFCLCVRFGG